MTKTSTIMTTMKKTVFTMLKAGVTPVTAKPEVRQAQLSIAPGERRVENRDQGGLPRRRRQEVQQPLLLLGAPLESQRNRPHRRASNRESVLHNPGLTASPPSEGGTAKEEAKQGEMGPCIDLRNTANDESRQARLRRRPEPGTNPNPLA